MADGKRAARQPPVRSDRGGGLEREAAADEAPNGEEPKAGAVEKEKGLEVEAEAEAEEPAAAEPPKLKGDAMAGATLIWARF